MSPISSRHLLLSDLVASSEKSQLISYSFESKSLKFQLYHATAGLIHFHIPTDTVHGRTVPSDPRRSTCRIDLHDLEQSLLIQGGRYMPPTEPGQFLNHAKIRMTLAYGRRASEHRWLLVLNGEYPLLACLVGDLNAIEWIND